MIFCGLGNPGPEYSATRHNMGFRAVDAMAREVKIAIEREKDEALYGRFVFKGEEHFLIKPLTFMNLSGRAVAKWLRRSSTPVEHLVVVWVIPKIITRQFTEKQYSRIPRIVLLQHI